MTLQRQIAESGFVMDPPPVGGLEAVKGWIADALLRVQERLQGPQVSVVVFGLQDALAPEAQTKPLDGTLVYLAAGVAGVGKPQGLYLRDGGAWKQVQAV